MEEKYICCFCYCNILKDNTDPIVLSIGSRKLLEDESDSPVQNFCAHSKCFKERIHPSVPFDLDIFLGE